MAVKKIEAAARRLVKKLADLALGPTASHGTEDGAAPATATKHEVNDVSEDEVTTEAPREAAAPETSPIRTRTLARLLAEQGHAARALAIYDELVAANAGDLTLAQEAEVLRKQQGRRPPTPTIEPVRAPAALYGRDQITASVVDPGTLFVHWEVTEEGAARARAVAESAGKTAGEMPPEVEPPVTLRIVVLRPDGAGVVRSEVIEHGPAPAGGETFVTGLPAEATLFAAVGIRRGERFVAITHAHAAHTPPAGPAELPALAFAPPPRAPASLLDETPPPPPVAVPLTAPAAVAVLQKADSLREPAPWAHSSSLDFHASSSS